MTTGKGISFLDEWMDTNVMPTGKLPDPKEAKVLAQRLARAMQTARLTEMDVGLGAYDTEKYIKGALAGPVDVFDFSPMPTKGPFFTA